MNCQSSWVSLSLKSETVANLESWGPSITTSGLSGLQRKVPMLKVNLGSSTEAFCRNESLAAVTLKKSV